MELVGVFFVFASVIGARVEFAKGTDRPLFNFIGMSDMLGDWVILEKGGV
jgi:hypothetical protein